VALPFLIDEVGSRTSAVELFGLIASDQMSPPEALAWLSDNRAAVEALPRLVAREIADVLQRQRR